MCRLFAVLANEPIRVNRAFEALQRQAAEHKDGWGIAVFDGGLGTPRVDVSTHSANVCERFKRLGDELRTKSMLAHIRLASVGAVSRQNAHPFFANGYAFMHNGTLQNFAASRAAFEAHIAPKWLAQVKGETDSERCFALFLTLLGDTENPSTEELGRALAGVMRIASQTCDRDDDAKKSAMNFTVTDGRRMVATRRGRTLFEAQSQGAELIASEPLWPGSEWVEVPEDAIVLIDGPSHVRRVLLRDW